MIKNLEHIGIAVKNLEEAELLYTRLLGTEPYKRESVESEGIVTSFFKVGQVKIELIASVKEGSAVEKFIERRGEGIHHLAFETSNIVEQMNLSREQGFELINAENKDGADNKTIAFLHPRSTGGVLIEFCQEKK